MTTSVQKYLVNLMVPIISTDIIKNIEVRMLIIILFILSLQLLKHVYRCLTQSTSQWKICHWFIFFWKFSSIGFCVLKKSRSSWGEGKLFKKLKEKKMRNMKVSSLTLVCNWQINDTWPWHFNIQLNTVSSIKQGCFRPYRDINKHGWCLNI